MITFYFRLPRHGELRMLPQPSGVPEAIAQAVVSYAAKGIEAPGLWSATMLRADDETRIDLSRMGDEDQAIAVLSARRIGDETELAEAWVDGGMRPRVMGTEALASAAAAELAELPEGDWHRLALLL